VAAEGTQTSTSNFPYWADGREDTPSRVPQRWGTASYREAAPLPPQPLNHKRSEVNREFHAPVEEAEEVEG
jgi:hypothetical protein